MAAPVQRQPLRHLRASARAAPLADAEVSLLRVRLFAGVLAGVFVVLLSRLWFLQVLGGDTFRAQAVANRSQSLRTASPRGMIEDSDGHVLVTNSAQFTVFVIPSDLPKNADEKAGVFLRLAQILEMTPNDLQAILKRNKRGTNPVAVAEGVTAHILARIAENRLWLPGVQADVEPVRKYVGKKSMAHLLGYIGQISDDEQTDENRKLGYQNGDFIGKSGIEKQYDYLLNGQAGQTRWEIDAKGRQQRKLGTDAPQPGATLRLSIEGRVQAACEKALNGQKGAAVAIDPRNGRVLALASNPTFDPNLLARRPLKTKVYREQIAPGLFDRATAAQMPPGSTFKIVTSAAGLALDNIGPNTYSFCGGGEMIGNSYKHCHSSHGSVNLTRALEASCDVFFYDAGRRIGPTPLADWCKNFGLGEKSGIDLPGEKAGLIPSPAWKKKYAARFHNPDNRWYPGDTANMAIGQGDVLATPLQMALVAGAIGNGGTVYSPRVLYRAEKADASHKVLYQMKPEVTHKLPLSKTQLFEIAQGMRQVVVGTRGTSHAANLAGIAVAGKSGSAEKRGGQAHGATHAWFVCYAPVQNPTIAICVFLESDGQNLHGGQHAAPIARQMMAAHFKVPDKVVPVGGGTVAD